MKISEYLMCPFLKGSATGALCGVVNKLVKDIEEVNIRMCMSNHHEGCSVYMAKLLKGISKPLTDLEAAV